MNSIRKHCTDEEVIALAKVLIKDWKRLLGARRRPPSSGSFWGTLRVTPPFVPTDAEKPAGVKNGLDSARAAAAAAASPGSSPPESLHR